MRILQRSPWELSFYIFSLFSYSRSPTWFFETCEVIKKIDHVAKDLKCHLERVIETWEHLEKGTEGEETQRARVLFEIQMDIIQMWMKVTFEVFEEWAINIKLGSGYPTWEKMLRQGKVLRRYYFGLSFHKIFPELLFHILCSPNSSKISLCLFANSGVIVLERLKKNRVEAKSKFSPLSPYESI